MSRTFAVATLAAAMLAAPAAADELAQAFERADQDGSGRLDVDEYVAAVVARFGELDEAGDGNEMLSPREIPDVSPAAFDAADQDGDGRLSVGEAVADRMDRFFEADRSRDGILSLDELRAYEQMQKEKN